MPKLHKKLRSFAKSKVVRCSGAFFVKVVGCGLFVTCCFLCCMLVMLVVVGVFFPHRETNAAAFLLQISLMVTLRADCQGMGLGVPSLFFGNGLTLCDTGYEAEANLTKAQTRWWQLKRFLFSPETLGR